MTLEIDFCEMSFAEFHFSTIVVADEQDRRQGSLDGIVDRIKKKS